MAARRREQLQPRGHQLISEEEGVRVRTYGPSVEPLWYSIEETLKPLLDTSSRALNQPVLPESSPAKTKMVCV